jgi:hypothetical protein
MSKPNYIVIKTYYSESNAVAKLSDKVNEKIEEGYIPQGGPFSFEASDFLMLCQAMVLQPTRQALTLDSSKLSLADIREIQKLFLEKFVTGSGTFTLDTSDQT